jgi:hypothetical protein
MIKLSILDHFKRSGMINMRDGSTFHWHKLWDENV